MSYLSSVIVLPVPEKGDFKYFTPSNGVCDISIYTISFSINFIVPFHINYNIFYVAISVGPQTRLYVM